MRILLMSPSMLEGLVGHNMRAMIKGRFDASTELHVDGVFLDGEEGSMEGTYEVFFRHPVTVGQSVEGDNISRSTDYQDDGSVWEYRTVIDFHGEVMSIIEAQQDELLSS